MYEGTRKQWRGDRPRQHFPRARCSPVPFFFFLLRRFSSGGFYNEPQRPKQSPEVPKAMHALSPSRHGRASLQQRSPFPAASVSPANRLPWPEEHLLWNPDA